MTAAVFVDRDGVLNEPVWDARTASFESQYRPEDVALVPGAAAGLARLRDAGFKLVLGSNQPAAAKGHVTRAELAAVHERVAGALRNAGVELDGAYYCHHHPQSRSRTSSATSRATGSRSTSPRSSRPGRSTRSPPPSPTALPAASRSSAGASPTPGAI